MGKKSIGFDFDLTLADSRVGIRDCLETICIEFSLAYDKNYLNDLSHSGLTLENTLKQLLNTDSIEKEEERFMELYPTLGVKGTYLIPGAKEILNDLHRAGCRIALLSAKKQVNLEHSLAHLKLEFDEVHGGLSGPDKASKMTNLKIDIYIGDQLSDVAAANNANALAILVGEDIPPLSAQNYSFMHFKNLHELRLAMPLILD